MIYAAFSPGGHFLAAGSADHNVRVYQMADEGPKRILETEAHRDTVDSIQWAHNSLRFVSGSKDGTANVWHFETQQWKSMRLDMTERLPTCPAPEKDKRMSVTMVGWDLSDEYVVTAVNDYTVSFFFFFLKIFDVHRIIISLILKIDKSMECRYRNVTSSNARSY